MQIFHIENIKIVKYIHIAYKMCYKYQKRHFKELYIKYTFCLYKILLLTDIENITLHVSTMIAIKYILQTSKQISTILE